MIYQYAVESHLQSHNLDPADIILAIPVDPETNLLNTDTIVSALQAHAATASFVLRSAVQFHTGQLLDIPRITTYAHEKGILVGWDLVHSAGNVRLKLHEWT